MSESLAPRPKRKPNHELRVREWLEQAEITQIRKAASKVGRHGHRDATMILIAFRHGLRCTELVNLRWEQFNLNEATALINRVKGSKSSLHTLARDEIAALRKLGPSRRGYVFCSELGGPVCERIFHRIVTRAGETAGLDFPIHPHMLRHSCGHYLANEGHPTRIIQDWLGHVNIQHTVRYTELNSKKFDGLWK